MKAETTKRKRTHGHGYRGNPAKKPLGRALAFGVVSFVLYTALYMWEDQILRWTTRGRWYFILPVAIAFLFSLFHGGFTGHFWEVLGVQPKTPKDKNKWIRPS